METTTDKKTFVFYHKVQGYDFSRTEWDASSQLQ